MGLKRSAPIFCMTIMAMALMSCDHPPEAKQTPSAPVAQSIHHSWNPADYELKIEPTKKAWKAGEYNDLTMTITNTSPQEVSFGAMTCSWVGQWRMTSKALQPKEWVCFSNMPETIHLAPGAAHTMTWAYLWTEVNANTDHFQCRVGFVGLGGTEPVWGDLSIALDQSN